MQLDLTKQNPLIRRMFIVLENGEWVKANELCEQVLNQEPENAYAYLGKLMISIKANTFSELAKRKDPFGCKEEYKNLMRFADDECRKYIVNICYEKAESAYAMANSAYDFTNAAKLYSEVGNNYDAALKLKECKEKMHTLAIEEGKKTDIRKRKVKKWVTIGGFGLIFVVVMKMVVYPAIYPWLHFSSLAKANEGDFVQFGKWNNNLTEKIEWVVLAVDNGRKLLLSVRSVEPYAFFDGKLASLSLEDIRRKNNIAKGWNELSGDTVGQKLRKLSDDVEKHRDSKEDFFYYSLRESYWLDVWEREEYLGPGKYYSQFNLGGCGISWEKSDIRTWLRYYFFYYAFDVKEKEKIVKTYNIDGGVGVYDKVFLLSKDEFEKYSVHVPVKIKDSYGRWWWLRTLKGNKHIATEAMAVNMEKEGEIDCLKITKNACVRPAMWVKSE